MSPLHDIQQEPEGDPRGKLLWFRIRLSEYASVAIRWGQYEYYDMYDVNYAMLTRNCHPPHAVILWIELPGCQAKMASIELWIRWRNMHRPHSACVQLAICLICHFPGGMKCVMHPWHTQSPLPWHWPAPPLTQRSLTEDGTNILLSSLSFYCLHLLLLLLTVSYDCECVVGETGVLTLSVPCDDYSHHKDWDCG